MTPLIITPEVFSLVILPILIFIARIADVTMATIRIIFISKGIKLLAPLVGFFEVLIWIIAVSQIMQNVSNVFNYIAYAAGFALGTYVGMYIEDRISLGNLSVRVITKNGDSGMTDILKSAGHKITVVDAYGTSGPVKIIYTIVKRKKLRAFVESVKNIDPKAFYSFGDIRVVKEEPPLPGERGMSTRVYLKRPFNKLKLFRKGR
jgi:uncharacterized protein YebE (UPF0316 family)